MSIPFQLDYTIGSGSITWLIRFDLVEDLLEDIFARLDSNLYDYKLVDDGYLVQEVYQLRKEMPLIKRSVAVWSSNTGLVFTKSNFWERRKSLDGIMFVCGTLQVNSYIQIQS